MHEMILQIKQNKYIKVAAPRLITILIIAINVLIFLFLEIVGDTEEADYMYRHGASYPIAILENKEYWRFFTATFLHFGMAHLLNNMVILACAGPFLEEALGHLKFLFLYIVSAVGSSYISYMQMYKSGDYAVSAGASGAIFGVIGGLLWVVIRHKGNYETLTTKGMIFMIALSLYYGISTAGVDNWSHLGGLLIGFFLSILMYRIKPKRIDLSVKNQYT